MLEQIKSKKVKNVNDAFNFGEISEKELNLMAGFSDEDLSEFLYLMNQEVISNDILAFYFIVYNKDAVNRIEKTYKYGFINELFAISWTNNYQNQTAEAMVDSLLGISFLNTDILSRIREGLKLDSKKLNAFELKVEAILKVFIECIDKGTFFKTLTTVNMNDKDALEEEDNKLFLEIKNDLKVVSNAIELYEINHGNFSDKEYLKNDQKKLSAYESELRLAIKSYFKVDDLKYLTYLPEIYKEVILGAITGDNNVKSTEEKVFKKNNKKSKDKDLLGSISTLERDEDEFEPVLNSGEDKIIGAVDRMLNGKKKTKIKEMEEKTPLACHDLILGMDEKKSPSVFSFIFKIVLALLAILAVVGWGFSLRSNNTDGADHVQELTYKEILSYKMSNGGEVKYDMKVNRSSNSGNVTNGTVKDSTPNIE